MWICLPKELYTTFISNNWRLLADSEFRKESLEACQEKKKVIKHRPNVSIWGEPEPEPEPEPTAASEPEPAAPEEAPDPESSSEVALCGDLELPYKERSLWTQHLRDAFVETAFGPALESDDSKNNFAPPKNSGSWEDFTPVFIDQARLYVLADKYGIEPLRQLILSKLHTTLTSFKLYQTGVAGVVEFVRFVYSNTPPNYGNKPDALRSLVARYIASVLGQIGDNEAFKELLEEGGSFVMDTWNTIWSGVTWHQST